MEFKNLVIVNEVVMLGQLRIGTLEQCNDTTTFGFLKMILDAIARQRYNLIYSSKGYRVH